MAIQNAECVELKASTYSTIFLIEVSWGPQLHTVSILIEINPSSVVNMPVDEGYALPVPECVELTRGNHFHPRDGHTACVEVLLDMAGLVVISGLV